MWEIETNWEAPFVTYVNQEVWSQLTLEDDVCAHRGSLTFCQSDI